MTAPPFGTHDYRIERLPPEAPHAVHIGAFAALPLRVGDLFTIDRLDEVCDLVVEAISYSAEGYWNARCRVIDPVPFL